jgi:hypothetical protein
MRHLNSSHSLLSSFPLLVLSLLSLSPSSPFSPSFFYFSFTGGGRKAAKVLKSANIELSIELEELADELAETHEKFGNSVKIGEVTTS